MSTPTTDRGGIEQVIRALVAAGWELHYVDDRGDETIEVSTEPEAVKAITDVDEAFLFVKRADQTGYVFFVLGNDPWEVVCDYTTNLDPTIGDLTSSWDA